MDEVFINSKLNNASGCQHPRLLLMTNIKNWHIASDNLILGEIEESAFSSKKAFANINGCRWAFYIDKDEF